MRRAGHRAAPRISERMRVDEPHALGRIVGGTLRGVAKAGPSTREDAMKQSLRRFTFAALLLLPPARVPGRSSRRLR